MKAVVRRIHLSDSGSKLYDLNIRENADPSRIRPNWPNGCTRDSQVLVPEAEIGGTP